MGNSIVVPGVNSLIPDIETVRFGSPDIYFVPAITGEAQKTIRHSPRRASPETLKIEVLEKMDECFKNLDILKHLIFQVVY